MVSIKMEDRNLDDVTIYLNVFRRYLAQVAANTTKKEKFNWIY